jgi:hypothetical protein
MGGSSPWMRFERVYGHEPLTDGLIRSVDPGANAGLALATARAVGYPVVA